MRTLTSVIGVVFLMTTTIAPVYAQSTHTAPLTLLDAAVQDHVAAANADRETVLRLLDRPEVRALAGDVGLDLRRAAGAVATMDGEQLSKLAAQARHAEEGLAGGQSRVVISTTAIIIGLLIIILLVLAID